MRKLTPEQAEAAYDVLVKHAGASSDLADKWAFVRNVVDDRFPCWEYRFCGSLGMGGKFRNNGNQNNTPHVDCYQESLTPEREAVIAATNSALAELFNTADHPARPGNGG